MHMPSLVWLAICLFFSYIFATGFRNGLRLYLKWCLEVESTNTYRARNFVLFFFGWGIPLFILWGLTDFGRLCVHQALRLGWSGNFMWWKFELKDQGDQWKLSGPLLFLC